MALLWTAEISDTPASIQNAWLPGTNCKDLKQFLFLFENTTFRKLDEKESYLSFWHV